MAVIAYASADASPKINPYVDPEVDLSAVSLPQTRQLYGDAYDSADPSNTGWDWSWTILDNDAGSPATLDDPLIQNPEITCSVWRNVLLFLIVTNTTSGATSETDPLLAPRSAFVTLRVLSEEAGIQKHASGERDWTEHSHDLAQAVEDNAGASVPAHTITDHSDVTTATGAELEILRGGSYVESGGSPLHIHKGNNIDVATPTTPGVVLLEEASATPSTPKVITKERIKLGQSAEISYTPSGIIFGCVPYNYPANDLIGSGAPLLLWRVDEEITIEGFSVRLRDGGPASPATNYRFALVEASKASAEALTWFTISGLSTPNGSPPTDNAPLLFEVTASSPPTIVAGRYLALLCLQAPRVTEGDSYGGGLSAEIYARRAV